jgi:4a-hydroxytetrahydrobiopterin dehydratase
MSDTLAADRIDEERPDGWEREDDELVRTFEFEDYLAGVGFAQRVAERADEEFHHPSIEIGWREVTVRWTTHDAGGITESDLEMAAACNDLR